MKLFEAPGVEVWTITEREGPQRKPQELFPDYDPAIGDPVMAAMPATAFAAATGRIMHSYQSFLLKLGGRNILIDTCVGQGKARPPHFAYPKEDWPATFARTGLAPADIDDVICTHLHVDHVGWNTVLNGFRWEPTFPKARYWFGDAECRYWQEQMEQGNDLAGRIWTDSVLPLLASGRAERVAMDHRFSEAIRFVPAPGHTPGMFRVDVQTATHSLIFATDIMHQPLQVRVPEWSTVFCEDPALAAETRKSFLEEVADTGAILFPEHFAYPVAGGIIRVPQGFAYRYLDGRIL